MKELFCSTIIATVGRPTLERTINSVLGQQFDQAGIELIVVNDSGRSLSISPWRKDKRVRLIHTNQREKSVARNTGASIAKGRYLHFLDDDDWLLPGALECFWNLCQNTEAVLYYGGTNINNREGVHLLDLQPEMQGNAFIQLLAGEWIPLGSYVLSAEAFFHSGGFNPRMTVGEDSDLCRRIALRGNITGSSELVLSASLGPTGSTADYSQLPQQSRWGREFIINEPMSLRRMRESADTCYWRGRIVRVYLSSAVWNIQNRRFFTAISRFTQAITCTVLSGGCLLSMDFWIAVGKPHRSISFARGFQKTER
jgi:glycosyltransferase involved in cell wall biosynthesis